MLHKLKLMSGGGQSSRHRSSSVQLLRVLINLRAQYADLLAENRLLKAAARRPSSSIEARSQNIEQLLTIVVVTSPTLCHPSTELIDRLLSSLQLFPELKGSKVRNKKYDVVQRRYLLLTTAMVKHKVRTIISCDGYRIGLRKKKIGNIEQVGLSLKLVIVHGLDLMLLSVLRHRNKQIATKHTYDPFSSMQARDQGLWILRFSSFRYGTDLRLGSR